MMESCPNRGVFIDGFSVKLQPNGLSSVPILLPFTILGCGVFSPPLHRRFWGLLEWHADIEPISQARIRRTIQVAQHDHRLARLRIHAKNRVHPRSAAGVAVAQRLVRPPKLESEAAKPLERRGVFHRSGLRSLIFHGIASTPGKFNLAASSGEILRMVFAAVRRSLIHLSTSRYFVRIGNAGEASGPTSPSNSM